MEKLSKNIIFDSEILNSENKILHTDQLRITSLNLDDFNKRLSTDIILRHQTALNAFTLETQYQKYGDLFVRYLSHCLAFYNDKNWLQNSFISHDIFIIKLIHDDFYYNLKEKQKDYIHDNDFNENLSVFLLRYDNYFPIGILDEYGENEYKNSVQFFVDSLKNLKSSIDNL